MVDSRSVLALSEASVHILSLMHSLMSGQIVHRDGTLGPMLAVLPRILILATHSANAGLPNRDVIDYLNATSYVTAMPVWVDTGLDSHHLAKSSLGARRDVRVSYREAARPLGCNSWIRDSDGDETHYGRGGRLISNTSSSIMGVGPPRSPTMMSARVFSSRFSEISMSPRPAGDGKDGPAVVHWQPVDIALARVEVPAFQDVSHVRVAGFGITLPQLPFDGARPPVTHRSAPRGSLFLRLGASLRDRRSSSVESIDKVWGGRRVINNADGGSNPGAALTAQSDLLGHDSNTPERDAGGLGMVRQVSAHDMNEALATSHVSGGASGLDVDGQGAGGNGINGGMIGGPGAKRNHLFLHHLRNLETGQRVWR